MDVFRQNSEAFRAIVQILQPDMFETAFAATLSDVRGRTGTRAVNDYNQWRTVAPFLGSVVIYTLTGSGFASGNPHVHNYNHNPNGQNVPGNFELTVEQKNEIVLNVRSLFPYTEIQRLRAANAGDFTIEKRLIITFYDIEKAVLLLINWNHGINADNITVTARTFIIGLEVEEEDEDFIIERFAALGFN